MAGHSISIVYHRCFGSRNSEGALSVLGPPHDCCWCSISKRILMKLEGGFHADLLKCNETSAQSRVVSQHSTSKF